MSKITDLLRAAVEKNPVQFAEVAQDIIQGKAMQALQDRRIEIAGGLYQTNEEAELDVDIDLESLEEELEVLDESFTKGTRLISKHEGKDGHHAEVRKSSEWNEFQVHHYHNGKHLGEGPVSYHDDKADATDTANYETKHFKVKGNSLVKE